MEVQQAILKLQDCGFSREQVEAIVAYNSVTQKQLATVHDLHLTESRLETKLATEIRGLETRLTLRLGTMAVFIVGVLGAMKFFA